MAIIFIPKTLSLKPINRFLLSVSYFTPGYSYGLPILNFEYKPNC